MSTLAWASSPPPVTQRGKQQGRQEPHAASPTSGSTATGSAADCSTPWEASSARVDDPAGTKPTTTASSPSRLCAVATNEVALERALVTVVVGIPPDLTLFDVQDYIMGHFGVEPGLFMVHLPYLEIFLVLFRDADVMMRWLMSTAQEILGSSCSIMIAMAPEMEFKANLKKFFVMVGCIHLDLLPIEKFMVAPIPAEWLDVQLYLRYRAVINILEVSDLHSTGRAPPGDSGTGPCWPAAPGGHRGSGPSSIDGSSEWPIGGPVARPSMGLVGRPAGTSSASSGGRCRTNHLVMATFGALAHALSPQPHPRSFLSGAFRVSTAPCHARLIGLVAVGSPPLLSASTPLSSWLLRQPPDLLPGPG
uniref:Uncharacterized protein n=1 Tax=Setaria italica TaxID=4555 RepID=K3XPX6_SETIT